MEFLQYLIKRCILLNKYNNIDKINHLYYYIIL